MCANNDLTLFVLSPSAQDDLMGEKLMVRGLVGCYALFQYLTVSIQAANAVYAQVREKLEELHRTLTEADPNRPCVRRLASECEVLAVQQAALLRYHNNVAVFPLVTLRQTLTSALPVWPASAALWSIYVQVSLIFFSHSYLRHNFIHLFWPD